VRKKEIDLNKLKTEYLKNKKNTIECAQLFNVSETCIRRRLKELNIKTRSFSEARRNMTNIDDNMIIDLYWNKGLSISQTAKKLNKSDNFIGRRLKDHGIGTRSISNGIRKRKQTENITDEKIIDLYENKEWSTLKISKYFNKSPDFARQRLLAIKHPRRKNVNKFNGSWKGGITDIKDLIRCGQKNTQWRKSIFNRAEYKSEISHQKSRDLECHHITPFSIILQSSMTKHKILSKNFKNLAIYNDERFYDLDNGLCLIKEEHDNIENNTHLDGHPWWRIWKIYPEFALIKGGFQKEDFIYFDKNGQIDPSNSIIRISSKKEVSKIIRYEHYLGTITFHNIVLVTKINNIITGIAVLGRGLNKRLPDSTMELIRLCIPHYVIRPFGCKFLNFCYQYLRDHYPNIKQLISFADPAVGHNGGIYRMAGWNKAGHGNMDYGYFDTINNRLRHKTSCRRVRGVDKTEKEIAEEKKFVKIQLPPKYKYTIDL
jgi:hypothetical protein